MQGFSVQVGCPHGSLPYREVADGVFSRVENVERALGNGRGDQEIVERGGRISHAENAERGEPIEGLTV